MVPYLTDLKYKKIQLRGNKLIRPISNIFTSLFTEKKKNASNKKCIYQYQKNLTIIRQTSQAQTLITIIRSDLSNKCDISKLQKKKKNYLNSSNTSSSREQEHEGDLNISRNRLNIIISASIIVHSDLITRSFG